MSDGHDHDAHGGAADAHHDHGFDGEPAKELGPDEPMTPGWVPALGGALFVGLALYGLLSSRDETPAPSAPAQTSAPAAQTVAQPVKPLPSTMRPQPLPGQPAPGGAASGAPGQPSIKRMTPDEIKELTKKLKDKGSEGVMR